MPQHRFWALVFPFQPLLDLVIPYWSHPIPQIIFRNADKEQSFVYIQLCSCSTWPGKWWPTGSPTLLQLLPWVQLLGPLQRELQHHCQPSFTLGKEQYGQTKSASALLSLTFQPKRRVGAMLCYTRFPPTLLLQAGVKSFFWWQSFCSWAHSFPSLAHQEVPPGSWLLRVKISSIPFPFNHPSWLMQYQKFICTFIIAKNIGILPCLATICCICFLFSSNWEFGSHLTITGSKGLFKYGEVLRKITAWIFSSKIAI